MNKESAAREVPVSKLLQKSKSFQDSVQKDEGGSKRDYAATPRNGHPPIFNEELIGTYVRDLVSEYLEKPLFTRPAEPTPPPACENHSKTEKVAVRTQSTISIPKSFKTESEKVIRTAWKPVKSNEKAKKSDEKRKPSSMTSVRLPFTRFTGPPAAEPSSFTDKHPTLQLDLTDDSDDDGRYLFHRRKAFDLTGEMKQCSPKNNQDSKDSTEYLQVPSFRKMPRPKADTTTSSSSSSSSVSIVESPATVREPTWHDTLTNRKQKHPIKVHQPRMFFNKKISPRKEVLEVILNTPRVQKIDKRELISKLKTKSFPVMAIKEKCNSVQKVVSISIEPQDFPPASKISNNQYYECVHEGEIESSSSERVHENLDKTSKVTARGDTKKELSDSNPERATCSRHTKIPEKTNKDNFNKFLKPFTKDDFVLCLDGISVNETPSTRTTSSSSSPSPSSSMPRESGKYCTSYNLIDSLFSDSKSALFKESSSQTDDKQLQDKSTSPDEVLDRILSIPHDLTHIVNLKSHDRKWVSERAKDLLNELDDICTSGQRTNSDSSISFVNTIAEKSENIFLKTRSRLSSSSSDDDDQEDTSTELNSFSSKSSESSVNGAVWDSMSDGEVLSLGEI